MQPGVGELQVEVGNWNEIPFRIAVSRNLFQLFRVIGVIFVWRSCENAIITMPGFTTHFHAFLRLSVLNRCKWPTGFPPSYLNFKLLALCRSKDGYYTYTTPPCCREGRKRSWHPLNTVCYYANTKPQKHILSLPLCYKAWDTALCFWMHWKVKPQHFADIPLNNIVFNNYTDLQVLCHRLLHYRSFIAQHFQSKCFELGKSKMLLEVINERLLWSSICYVFIEQKLLDWKRDWLLWRPTPILLITFTKIDPDLV